MQYIMCVLRIVSRSFQDHRRGSTQTRLVSHYLTTNTGMSDGFHNLGGTGETADFDD